MTDAARRKIFYDCEFLEDGRVIDLISIGMVDDTGREYYAVNELAPWHLIANQPWLMGNVVPSLPQLADIELDLRTPNPAGVDTDHPHMRLPGRIATEVRQFILGPGAPVELWAWYGAYDHVALCQLWGRMIDLPDGIPMFTCDIRQEALRLGDPEMPEQADGVHNALADARHNRVRWEYLRSVAKGRQE